MRFFNAALEWFAQLPEQQRDGALAAVGSDQARTSRRSTKDRGRPSRAFVVASSADNAVGRRARLRQPGRGDGCARCAARRNPKLAGDAARHPRCRGKRRRMSDPIGTYTFLPWIRHGHRQPDRGAGDNGAARDRRRRPDVEGSQDRRRHQTLATVPRNVELYGPGDIIGIDPRADQPDRAARLGHQLRAQLPRRHRVLRRGFPLALHAGRADGQRCCPGSRSSCWRRTASSRTATASSERPLPYIEVTARSPTSSAAAAELWAWAHAHFNADFGPDVVETDAASGAAEAAAYAICQPTRTGPARASSARASSSPTRLSRLPGAGLRERAAGGAGHRPRPLFDDAANGLTPRVGVGRVSTPGNRPEAGYLPRLSPLVLPHRRAGRLRVPGAAAQAAAGRQPRRPPRHRRAATRAQRHRHRRRRSGRDPADGRRTARAARDLSPHEQAELDLSTSWAAPYPHAFPDAAGDASSIWPTATRQTGRRPPTQIRPDSDAIKADPDPLITPPLYGRWHALTDRLLNERDGSRSPERDNWVHELNLDPRYRVAAGFGTAGDPEDQESYMEAAWDQIGDVLEANRRIRLAQFARMPEAHARAPCGRRGRVAGRPAHAQAPVAARVVSDGDLTRRVHRGEQSPMSRRWPRPRCGACCARVAGLPSGCDFGAPASRGQPRGARQRREVTAAPPKTRADQAS